MSRTPYLDLNIPDKSSKGFVVTDVFEPNFTKLDQEAERVNLRKMSTEDNIEELKKANRYKLGDIVEVLGFYEKGDGAHHKRMAKAVDDGSGELGQNGIWWCIVHSGEVNVSWFGAKGDGVTDDSLSINKAMKIGSIVNLQSKTYLIDGSFVPEWESTFQSYGGLFVQDNQTINFNNSTIKLKTESGNQPSCIQVMGKKNVILNNPNLVGVRNGVTEWGHGILLWTSNPNGTNSATEDEWCSNIKINNAVISGFNGDSIYISGAKNVFIENPIAIANRRNGITINSGIDVYVNNYFAKDIDGTDPQSAIDIETDFQNGKIDNITFNGVTIQNCNNAIFVLANQHKVGNINLKDIVVSGSLFKSSPFKFFLDTRYTQGSVINVNNLDYSKVAYRTDKDNPEDGFKTSIISATDIDGNINKLIIDGVNTCYSTGTYNIFNNSYKDMLGGSLSFGVVLKNLKNNSTFYIIEKSAIVKDKSKISVDSDTFFFKTSVSKEEWLGDYVNTSSDVKDVSNFNNVTGSVYINNNTEEKTLYLYARKVKTKIQNKSKGTIKLFSNSAQEKFRNNYSEYNNITTNSDIEIEYNPIDNVYEIKCNIVTINIEKLDTPYYTLKMQQEGIYDDYVAYRDELHEYENSQTTDETMLLPVLHEPIIPESVELFAKKYDLV